MADIDTTLLERTIGDTVEATANTIFEALHINASAAGVREMLRPLYREWAAEIVATYNAMES